MSAADQRPLDTRLPDKKQKSQNTYLQSEPHAARLVEVFWQAANQNADWSNVQPAERYDIACCRARLLTGRAEKRCARLIVFQVAHHLNVFYKVFVLQRTCCDSAQLQAKVLSQVSRVEENGKRKENRSCN